MSAYDPPSVLPKWTSVNPRPFPPILPPPEHLILPSLPSGPRQLTLSNLWTLSTHIIPAAYSRVSPNVPQPERLPESLADKNERRRLSSERATELLAANIKHRTDSPAEGNQTVLWNCINRYVPVTKGSCSSGMGLTLFFAHANGFYKEIWEPALEHMLSCASGPPIDEIWCWEAVQHGDSALINKDNLHGVFDWTDNSRDILNFLVNYLPLAPTNSALPTHLPRINPEEAESRKSTGYKERTLVVVGHSFGGTTSALVAINYPALFSSLILVDPIILQPHLYGKGAGKLHGLVAGALQRRDRWHSREEALRSFRLIPFFATWAPEVLRNYVEHGLTPDPRGGFMLKTPGIQEAIVFADYRVACEVWELLERLDERVELRFIMPGKPKAGPVGDDLARIGVWRRPKNTSNIRITNAGHLIPQEAPKEFADDIRNFIQRKYGSVNAKL